MRVGSSLLLLCAWLGACATLPAAGDTPFLPPGVFGVYQDNDTGAINFASWAFSDSNRIRNNPVDAAKAVIAVEYLAGELRASPRWISVPLWTRQQMLEARADVRQVLGIRQDAPPQLVVNTMLQVVGALVAGNQPAALQALSAPGFTFAPPQTLALLGNLPFVAAANQASSRLASAAISQEDLAR